VRYARGRADLVVVDLHWGTERMSCPTEAQRSLARALADAGADVIVGSHAHVVLGAGWLPGGHPAYVDYGLGNFVFYNEAGAFGESGVLTLTVTGGRVTAGTWTPARLHGGVPVPLTGAAADAGAAHWRALRHCTGLSRSAGAAG
jgi:poly-gamma-glutamate synthesis protein (capsule biosynthesis protein)